MPVHEGNIKRCPNCTKFTDQYITFPPSCGHVICTQCCPNDPATRTTPLDRSKCPVCQQMLLFPNADPKEGFQALKLFGYVRDCLLDRNPPYCRSCNDGGTRATAQCENEHCLMYLCQECSDRHIQQSTMNEQHYVYTFQDIRLGRSRRSARHHETTCCAEGLEVNHFCSRCEITICDVCVSDHRDHLVRTLREGLQAYIRRYTERIEAWATKAGDMRQSLTVEREHTQSEYEAREREINNHAEEIIRKVQKDRDNALTRLKEERAIYDYHQKPLEEVFGMSEAQVSAMQTSISLMGRVVEGGEATKDHLIHAFTFLKANTRAIDDITEAIRALNNRTDYPTPFDVFINTDVHCMVNRVQVFSALPRETPTHVLQVDTRVSSDSFEPNVVSMDTFSYNGDNCIFIADDENFKVKVFNMREEDDGLQVRLHKENIALEKEPAVVFQDGVRDERNQLNEAICIHYTDSSDPGSYHKLEDALHPFDNIKPLQPTLKFFSVGQRYNVEAKWNKSAHALNLNEHVARECLRQGYFLLELLNTMRIDLKYSRCIEEALFAISGLHRPSNRSILMIGWKERPLRILRFGHEKPGGVAIDSKLNIFCADPCNNRIIVLNKLCESVRNLIGFECPVDLCVIKQVDNSPTPGDSDLSQAEQHTRKPEYLAVIERKGRLKVFDLSQIMERG